MMRSLDGLAWTARWMVRFRGTKEEARGYRGEYLEAVLRGESNSRVDCEFPRGRNLERPRQRDGAKRGVLLWDELVPGAGWDTY